jgi:hypothetical protein
MLWIFGILLALTSAGGGGSANYQIPSEGGSNWMQPLPNPGDFNFPGDLDRIFPNISSQLISTMIALGIGLVCLILLLAVVGTIVRYVSETALIRLVDSHESSGEKVGFRQGWRMGWSRAALSIFLIDLLIGIITVVVFLLLFGFALSPLLAWLVDNTALRVIGTAASVGMGMLVFFLAVVVNIIALLIHLSAGLHPETAKRVRAIRRGINRSQTHRGCFHHGRILSAVACFCILMIPVFIILAVAESLSPDCPPCWWALINFGRRRFDRSSHNWPADDVDHHSTHDLMACETFNSSTWTLTYRELVAVEGATVVESE